MTIKTGDHLPEGKLAEFIETETEGCSLGPNTFNVSDLVKGKTIAIFGLPGAYTPTCSAQLVPGYVQHAKELKAKGVDEIWCISVNDAFVMNKWAQDQGLKNLKMIPDGSGTFTRLMGMLVDKDNLGFGMRSWRYAMVVNNGRIEKFFEEPGRRDNATDDPYGETSPEKVLDYLKESMYIPYS